MVGRRAPVRSSARLSSGGGSAAAAGGGGGGGVRPAGERAAAAVAAAAAAAAARRARAAERAREVEDSPRELRDKCRRLARALQNAKHLVVYTGAGISTAADIPDYRGPRGVWTRLQRGEAVGRVEVARARPTFTHMALTALWARGTLKFVVSQNCDGLHVRAGLPRRALAELHGNMFAERCAACRRVYLRAFDTTPRTARHAHGTRRLCHACGAELQDSIVHFGERGRAAWPLNWAGALRHAAAADVVLCLGSSLKVLRRYPRLWRMHAAPAQRPALYIVNLQWTPKDAAAKLKINARCDAVMAQVARRLRLRVPRYRARRDPLLAHAEPLLPQEVHTARRAARPPPSPAPAPAPTPTPSDSDDELPLRRLAERLRGGPRAASPAVLPGLLHAFQVNMKSGDATILLRAEHAPSVSGAPPPRGSAPRLESRSRALSELRRFRMARPVVNGHMPTTANGHVPTTANGHVPTTANGLALPVPNGLAAPVPNGLALPVPNGLAAPVPNGLALPVPNGLAAPAAGAWCLWRRLHGAPPAGPHAAGEGPEEKPKVKLEEFARPVASGGEDEVERKTDVDGEAKVKTKLRAGARNGLDFDAKPETDAPLEIKTEDEVRSKPAVECGAGGAGEEAAEGGWAAALIARAVLVCRAQLYPGLHSMIAPEPAACAWCARHCAARRCLWYGPPALTPPARRRGRRLCACCPAGPAPPAAAPAPPADGAGWYGKGYRKGRRRKRAH